MSMAFSNAPFNEDSFMEKEFLKLKDQFNIKTVIETGTYHGVTTKWLSENFNQIKTIEVNKTHYDKAKQFLNYIPNINMFLGESSLLLGEILKLSPNPLVFLDAHWYTNPVLEELKQIKESGIKPVLVIHDFKNPHHPDFGYDTYPDQGIIYEWDWIKDKIEDIYGEHGVGYNYYYNSQADGAKRGCVFIAPIKE